MPVGRSTSPGAARGSSVEQLAHVAGEVALGAGHRGMQDAVAVDDEAPGRGQRVDALRRVLAEQARGAVLELGAGEMAVAVALGLAQRVAQAGVEAARVVVRRCRAPAPARRR